jgi:hypothetical protein
MFKLNKKGEISITLIILVLTSMVFIAGYYNAVKINYAMDEIQSNLDIVGVSTLEKLTNFNILKDEIYGIDKQNKIDYYGANQVLKNYKDIIKTSYKNELNFDSSVIRSYSIVSQDIYFERSTWGTGNSRDQKPQIVLETVMKFIIKISRGHDYTSRLIRNFYSSKSNKNLQVLSVGSLSDGRTELVVRSAVRSIYN